MDVADWSRSRVLVVGLGGLGCPLSLALVQAGVGQLVLLDDDPVEETNLHRQLLYRTEHLGASKVECAAEVLSEEAARSKSPSRIEALRTRLLPENARELVRSVDLVLEGADNFATKFLSADACYLERKPVVHGAALRWQATAWAVSAYGRPCYRCLFEDIPSGNTDNCSTLGVMGPVVGFGAALMAELALRCLADRQPFGELLSFNGHTDRLRTSPIHARTDCALCGAAPQIMSIRNETYFQSAQHEVCA
jgi:molybdopterin/thiamine biosynthesis adenylyltransferase